MAEEETPVPSSVSHAISAVAIAAAIAPRQSWRRVASIGALAAVAPDLDGLPRLLGWNTSALLVHRGLTHSVWFAVAAAACLSVGTWRRSGASRTRMFVFLALALLSHGVLDTFSNYGSGVGVALLSPLSAHRFNAPWQPITGEISEFAFCLIPLTLLTVGILHVRRIPLSVHGRREPTSLALHDPGGPAAPSR